MKRRYYPPSMLNHQMRQLSVGEMARQGAIGIEDIIRNKVSKIRHWKLTSLGKKRPKWGFEFTVMTYNILSQAAVESHMYLYRKCNPQYLSEEYRISRILPEILKSKSDVVCLQEVEQYLYDQRIKQVFDSNGFGSIFKKRTGNKSDGCAILWRRAKFRLLEHQEVEYRTRSSDLLNRDNIGLIAVLRPKHPQASETHLHIATTHLIFNPRRGDVKLCQLRLLLAELERLSFKEENANGRVYHPTVLCGDFNFEPHSPLYKFVETGRIDVSGLICGNMSGQYEGKGKGSVMDKNKLSLNELGIDESGRFNPSIPTSTNSSNPQKLNIAGGHYSNNDNKTNSPHLESYRALTNVKQSTLLQTSSDAPERSESNFNAETSSKLFYHGFNFVPAYKYRNQDQKTCPITSMTGNDCNTVDHIFYNVKEKSSTSFAEDRLKLLGIYSLPQADDLRDLDGLPNAHLGSDHLCLMSNFIISFK